MRSPRPLLRSAAPLALGRAGATLVAAAWLIVAARLLSLDDFGRLVLVIAIGTICINLSDRGLQLVVQREVAASGHIARNLVAAVLWRRLVAAAVLAVVCVALYLVVTHGRGAEVPLVFSVSIFASTVHTTVLAAYRGLGESIWDGGNQLLSRLLVLGAGVVWLANGGGLLAAVAVYALADVVSAAILFLLLARRHLAPAAAALPSLRLIDTAPFLIATSISVIYQRLDNYIVGLLRGTPEAGLYGASYRFLDAALIPAAALAGLVLAHTTRLEPVARWRATGRVSLQALALTLIPVSAGAVFAGQLATLTFGRQFVAATPVIVVLLLSGIPSAVALVAAPVAAVTSAGAFARVAVAILALNLLLNLALVPFFGGLGAAWANVVSQACNMVLLLWLIRRPALVSPPG